MIISIRWRFVECVRMPVGKFTVQEATVQSGASVSQFNSTCRGIFP